LKRLPKKFINILDIAHAKSSVLGHNGSHAFLVDDFVRSVVTGKLPPVNAWTAAQYTVPGIYAHKSAMKGGVTLQLPEIGEPPADWELVDFNDIDYSKME
jgi:hypothetical protein